MDEYQNGYAEWKKLDPEKKKVYSVWVHFKSRNAKQSTLIESKAVFSWRERSGKGWTDHKGICKTWEYVHVHYLDSGDGFQSVVMYVVSWVYTYVST